jgi:uncharacterized membrane protein
MFPFHAVPLLFFSTLITKGGLSHHPLKAATWCVVVSCLSFLLHNIEKGSAASVRLHHHHLTVKTFRSLAITEGLRDALAVVK